MSETRMDAEMTQPKETDLEVANRVLTLITQRWGQHVLNKDNLKKVSENPEETFVFINNHDEYRKAVGKTAHPNSIGHSDGKKMYFFTGSSEVSEDEPWEEIRETVITHEVIEFLTGLRFLPETEKIREEISPNPTIIANYGCEILFMEKIGDNRWVNAEYESEENLREYLTDALTQKLMESQSKKYIGDGYIDGREPIGIKLIDTLGEDVIAKTIFNANLEAINEALKAKSGGFTNIYILSTACEKRGLEDAKKMISDFKK